jgi:hypothetical protein
MVTALALACLGPVGAQPVPANTLRDLFMTLNKCLLEVPPGVAGSEITVVFSLKRDGSLLEDPGYPIPSC